MWFIGFVIGAAFGGALGAALRWEEAWLFFGAAGAVIALLVKTGRLPTISAGAGLEARLAALEREVRALKSGLANARAPADVPPIVEPRAQTPAEAATPDALAAAPLHVAPPQPASNARTQATATQPAALPAAAPREPSWLAQKVFGGNILAKVGVVLLLIGIGSGLKLAIDFGLFPPSVRLLIATVAGLGMIAFGYSRVRVPEHRMFGLALQGGGFGVLYLVTYFALTRYGYVGPAPAFGAFAALGIACLLTALRFEGEPLAILGISGAFLAPLLASTGAGSHLVLFSYYAVLDVLVLGINAWRMWRTLAAIAFAFTVFTGMAWAVRGYTPEIFVSTQAFLVLFAVLFSAGAILPAVLKRAEAKHWAQSAIVFGTPVAAAVAESWLMSRSGYPRAALAWASLGAGAYYAALAAALLARRSREDLRAAHGAIAVAFFTLAVPLAFGVQVTSAFWAIEGVALAWYGIARRRARPYAAGLVLQLGAGVYFLGEAQAPRPMAVLNAVYVGAIVIAACGAASASMTRRGADAGWISKANSEAFAVLAGLWAIVWWLGANFAEIHRYSAPQHEVALCVGTLAATAWALWAAAGALDWREARYAALALAAAAILPGLYDPGPFVSGTRHSLHDTMVFALPAAFVTCYALLARAERENAAAALGALHVYAVLVLAAVVLREALWIAGTLAPQAIVWRVLAWQVVPAASVYALLHLERHTVWPVSTQRRAYLAVAAPVLLALSALAALHANVRETGGGTGLPYLPVASFFDVAQIAVIAMLVAWSARTRGLVPPRSGAFAQALAAGLAFVWLSAMALRLAHHWGGVAFEARALLASGMAQSLLSLVWTAIALALMIDATRKLARQRWFAGFALLGVVGAKFMLIDVVNKGTVTWTLSLIGVGLLILAASYFSPAPPKAASSPQVNGVRLD